MRAALALGSNLPSRFGDPAANLREALHRLHGLGEVTAVSSFCETDPVGYTAQPRFINAAAVLQTHLDPLALLHGLLAIETGMGRVRTADTRPKGPRVIDLDLLLCEHDHGPGLTLANPDLILPHPELANRRFVLAPLAEIAGDWQHPVLHRTVNDLLATLENGNVASC